MVNFTAADRVGGIGGYIGGIATLLGLAGNGWGMGAANCNASQFVTKDELKYVQDLSGKDAEIALLKAGDVAEQKMIDVYKQVKSEMNGLEAEVRLNRREQDAVNAAQQVYNATNTSAVAVLNTQVAQLMGLTALKIPKTSICPEPMDRFNSWTAPTAPSTGG